MTIGALAFLSPWLLVGLAALPVIYWLLRTVPPRPQRIAFPATRILVGIQNEEQQPAKTPWWLMLIRLAAAAFVILALADPVLNPNRDTALKGSGPVVIVVDNTWAAAAHWAQRQRMVARLIDEAEAGNRPVAVVATALPGASPQVRIEPPGAARSTAAALQPQPFGPQRMRVAGAITTALSGLNGATAVWLTDGIDHSAEAQAFVKTLSDAASGGVVLIDTGPGEDALGVAAGLGTGGRLEATVLRAAGGARDGIVVAYSNRGQRLGDARFQLAPGVTSTTAAFDLPLELRNQVSRVEIAGERSAGAVNLLDARSQWHRVGVFSGESREQSQPLLAPLYYIQRALAPFAELVSPKDANLAQGLDQIIRQNSSVIMLADIGTLSGETKTKVDEWVKRGGILVRFAGPRLEKGGDDLLPVTLRVGGRTLGGALSWQTPQPLAAMPDDSVFAGLAIPPDVTVNRQVLADPAKLGPDVKIWARLKDGTPLVTAAAHGKGQLVLFHATANTDWSSLPISGLFVEMLRRVTILGREGPKGTGEATGQTNATTLDQPDSGAVLTPLQVLDGLGSLRSPTATVQPIPVAKLADVVPSAENPPGFYGPQESPRAINLMGPTTELKTLPPLSIDRRAYEGQTATPLKPQLLTAALALLFTDILAILVLQAGGLAGVAALARRAGARASALLVAIGIAAALMAGASSDAAAQVNAPGGQRGNPPPPARTTPSPALSPEMAQALRATAKVSFGYVLSGDPSVDETSRAGLTGLNKVLVARTAVDPGDPSGVNIDTQEISFFPVLYWPVLNNARPLTDTTLAKIDAYMKQGGMIIFDTRDYGQGMPSGFTAQAGTGSPLQRLLGRLDIPRLEPVPEGHVLTKSFYLLRSFPGRWDGGQLWVEAQDADAEGGRRARHSDGVSSILITSNDFASAWALDDRNRPVYPTVPGGELQREQAFRTGVNIVMYALTGNYKADQVHVPALLERLGQ